MYRCREGRVISALHGGLQHPPPLTQPYRRKKHKLNRLLPFLPAQTTVVALGSRLQIIK